LYRGRYMALIKCSECGRDVSDQAPACPNCGHLVNVQTVTTIQLTHKKWKGYKVVGAALILFGFLIAGGGNDGLGVFFVIIGFFAAMIGKIGAWWNHA
jgi:DNA-directed RNA polymerase subunit RPC12/RpoP